MKKLFYILLCAVLLGGTAYASEDECERGHEQCGHDDGNTGGAGGDGGTGGDGGSGGDTDVDVTATGTGEGGEGGGGGNAQVNTSNKSSSIVLTGARDTAECFTKVGIGAEGFGIFWSRKDKWCRKVRSISRQLILENWDAAAKLECTLPEWREVYGKDKKTCRDALYAGPPEYDEPTTKLISHDEYHSLMAEVQREEFEDQQQMVEDKFAQYDNLIESQQEKAVEDDAEIDRLKIEAAALRAAEKEREEKEAARRAAARAALEKEEEEL